MGLAYVRRPKGNTVLIAQRDYDEMRSRGWIVAHDYVEVDSSYVVVEVDDVKLTGRIVGFATSPGNVRKMSGHVNSRYQQGNFLLRLKDLVTFETIAQRTERQKVTISNSHAVTKEWPKPIWKAGTTNVFLWPEIKSYFKAKGLPIRRRSPESNKRPSPRKG